MPGPADPPRPAAAPLPWQLRVARLAETLYVPVAVFLLLGLSAAYDPLAIVLVLFQIGMAVTVIVRLKRRSRFAWVAAMVLAVYILVGMAMRAGPVVRTALERPEPPYLAAVAILAWVALTQLVVLASCAALRDWRTALR